MASFFCQNNDGITALWKLVLLDPYVSGARTDINAMVEISPVLTSSGREDQIGTGKKLLPRSIILNLSYCT